MLRWVVRPLRVGALTLGIVAAAATVLSYAAYVTLSFPWPGDESYVTVKDGHLSLGYLYEDLKAVGVGIPLWFLAIVFLAWPVTSFIIARRKQRRGFPVDATTMGSDACPAPQGHPEP